MENYVADSVRLKFNVLRWQGIVVHVFNPSRGRDRGGQLSVSSRPGTNSVSFKPGRARGKGISEW